MAIINSMLAEHGGRFFHGELQYLPLIRSSPVSATMLQLTATRAEDG
jgi:hypothetical protein